MKLKLVVVDLEMSPRARKWCVRLGVPAVILGVATVALAGPLHVWADGDTLDAVDLNGNFSNLQAQLTPIVARGGAAVWKDATGAIVPVFAVDTSFFESLWMPDAKGNIWLVGTATGNAGISSSFTNVQMFYTSSNCGGTAYVQAFTPGVVFTADNDPTYRTVPTNASLVSISIGSYFGQGMCTQQTVSSSIIGVTLASTTPSPAIVKPAAPLFTAPAYPVFMP
jgi:hypothetical protein